MAGDLNVVLPYKEWIAFHQPAGSEDTSMTFDTEKEAEEHILKLVRECKGCRGKVRFFRKSNMWITPCGAEWEIYRTDDFMRCETMEDFMVAAGQTLVYAPKEQDRKKFRDALKKFGKEGEALDDEGEARDIFLNNKPYDDSRGGQNRV